MIVILGENFSKNLCERRPTKLAEALALMLKYAVHDLTSRRETYFEYSITMCIAHYKFA